MLRSATTIVLAASLLPTLLGGCTAHKKIEALQAQVEQKDEQIQQLTDENRGYMVQVDELRQEVSRLDKKNAALAAWYDGVLDEFGPELDNGQVQLVVYPDRTVLEMPEQVYFESGSASLTDAGKSTLGDIANLMKEYPNRRFQVEGHTDPEPISTSLFADNWALGSARSIVVVRELVAPGVNEDQLSAATYGDTSPVASNASEEGFARNRRISVAIEPTPEESGAHLALYERARSNNRFVAADGVTNDRPPVATAQ